MVHTLFLMVLLLFGLSVSAQAAVARQARQLQVEVVEAEVGAVPCPGLVFLLMLYRLR